MATKERQQIKYKVQKYIKLAYRVEKSQSSEL